jgi:hypothetical protein
MLDITAATVVFGDEFTQVINIVPDTPPEGGGSGDPPPDPPPAPAPVILPVVTASVTDAGVTVKPELIYTGNIATAAKVTISGKYTTIIKTNWEWLDNTGAQKSGSSAPPTGTFKKITKVDSPANLKETCIYTIDGLTFTHTVDLVSFDKIGNLLKSLVATVA